MYQIVFEFNSHFNAILYCFYFAIVSVFSCRIITYLDTRMYGWLILKGVISKKTFEMCSICTQTHRDTSEIHYLFFGFVLFLSFPFLHVMQLPTVFHQQSSRLLHFSTSRCSLVFFSLHLFISGSLYPAVYLYLSISPMSLSLSISISPTFISLPYYYCVSELSLRTPILHFTPAVVLPQLEPFNCRYIYIYIYV